MLLPTAMQIFRALVVGLRSVTWFQAANNVTGNITMAPPPECYAQ